MTNRLEPELELAEVLRPTAAPDELWDRIRTARNRPSPVVMPRQTKTYSTLPIAAIITVMIAAAMLWLVARGQDRGLDLRQMAMLELRNAAPLDLETNDIQRINDWTRQQTGLDLAIPEQAAAKVTGARIIRKEGSCIAAVSFRVGKDTATLLVAKASQPGEFGHTHAQWQAHGQSYALATSNSEHSEIACRLCHAAL